MLGLVLILRSMHAVGTLIGIALNLCVALGSEDTLLILPVHRCFLFFLRFYFYYLFLERGREQGGEKHQCPGWGGSMD